MMYKNDGSNYSVFEFLFMSKWKAFMFFFALVIKCTQNYDTDILKHMIEKTDNADAFNKYNQTQFENLNKTTDNRKHTPKVFIPYEKR